MAREPSLPLTAVTWCPPSCFLLYLSGPKWCGSGFWLPLAWRQRGETAWHVPNSRVLLHQLRVTFQTTWCAKPWVQLWSCTLSRAGRRCWGYWSICRHRTGILSWREEEARVGALLGCCVGAQQKCCRFAASTQLWSRRDYFPAWLWIRAGQGKRHNMKFLPQIFHKASVML